jgi:hypothetical protein
MSNKFNFIVFLFLRILKINLKRKKLELNRF